MCNPLICKRCLNGTLVWLEDPDEVENAKMQCRNCGKKITMEAYCKNDLRNRMRKLWRQTKGYWWFTRMTIRELGFKDGIIYLVVRHIKTRPTRPNSFCR